MVLVISKMSVFRKIRSFRNYVVVKDELELGDSDGLKVRLVGSSEELAMWHLVEVLPILGYLVIIF